MLVNVESSWTVISGEKLCYLSTTSTAGKWPIVSVKLSGGFMLKNVSELYRTMVSGFSTVLPSHRKHCWIMSPHLVSRFKILSCTEVLLKYPVVSCLQMLKCHLEQWSLAWQPCCLAATKIAWKMSDTSLTVSSGVVQRDAESLHYEQRSLAQQRNQHTFSELLNRAVAFILFFFFFLTKVDRRSTAGLQINRQLNLMTSVKSLFSQRY